MLGRGGEDYDIIIHTHRAFVSFMIGMLGEDENRSGKDENISGMEQKWDGTEVE